MTKRTIAFSAALALGGCTSGQVGPLPINTVNPFQGTSLQFAVGTFRYSAGAGPYPTGATFLNMMESFRNGAGHSAVTYDVPTVTGPCKLRGRNQAALRRARTEPIAQLARPRVRR